MGFSPELTVVVPCYNEAANVAPLVARLEAALAGLRWEVVFVDDDSPDGTAATVRAIAAADPRVRCLRRMGRRGLSSAVVEGALSSSAAYIAVIDGDLQHDETRLPDLLAAVRAGADIAVGSRHVPRRRFGRAGRRVAAAHLRRRHPPGPAPAAGPAGGPDERLLPASPAVVRAPGAASDRAGLQDPAGSHPLRPRAAAGDGNRLPVPSPHRRRSKLDVLVLLQFAALLLDKATRGLLPLRFVSFALVGAVGVLVHLAVLTASRSAGLSFEAAQIAATGVAILANFQLNNAITYRDQRLRGPALWRGLALFLVVCGLGAYANIGIARVLYADHSGWTPAGLAGAAIGLVWNYAVSATLVWRAR
ncbi:MAG: glycosyltransferase [Acetobacteraceae bacterium]